MYSHIQDETLENELPTAQILFWTVTTAFRDQLECAFVDYCYQVRSFMISAFAIMKRHSFAVRHYLQRNESKDQGMSKQIEGDAASPSTQQQIESLNSQVQSLRQSLQDTRNQLKQ